MRMQCAGVESIGVTAATAMCRSRDVDCADDRPPGRTNTGRTMPLFQRDESTYARTLAAHLVHMYVQPTVLSRCTNAPSPIIPRTSTTWHNCLWRTCACSIIGGCVRCGRTHIYAFVGSNSRRRRSCTSCRMANALTPPGRSCRC